MNNPIEDLRQYLRVSYQEKIDPQACYRRHPAIEPEICSKYADGMANGESEGCCCQGCPIQDYSFCPNVEDDRISMSALEFTAWYDHPAHEGYKHLLFESIGPTLSPAEIIPWLKRRQAVYETIKTILDEEAKIAADNAAKKPSMDGGQYG